MTPTTLRIAFIATCLLIAAYNARRHILNSPRLCLALAGVLLLAVFALDTPK